VTYYEQGLAMYQELGLPYEIAQVLLNLANALRLLNQPQKALQYYYQAKETFTTLGEQKLLSQVADYIQSLEKQEDTHA
jgi:hypothetical protein